MEQTRFSHSGLNGSVLPDVAGEMPELVAEAITFQGDRTVSSQSFETIHPSGDDVVVETEMTGISAGTEKLLWAGDMPPFPGMGYPLVPGYETVGRVIWAEAGPSLYGKRVFVPGSYSLKDVKCLFGGAASRITVPATRVRVIDHLEPDEGIMLSLAATAHHAIASGGAPNLIVGFGALGRLIFRVAKALGHPQPAVWESNPARGRAEGIVSTTAEGDAGQQYRSVYDASGNSAIIDRLMQALKPRGTLILAGFYSDRVSFDFAPAFIKEARIQISAEWSQSDMDAVLALIDDGRLSLADLVTHTMPWHRAAVAYDTAFNDPNCLKMTLDWRS